MKRKSLYFIFLILLAASNDVHSVPYEKYSANITPADTLAFDNFASEQYEGQCYAMVSLVEDAKYLFKFDPAQSRLSPAQNKQIIETALCTQIPTVIPGFESLQDLSLDHQDILKKILVQYQTDLLKRLNNQWQCYGIITGPVLRKKTHRNERLSSQEEVLNKILPKIKSGEPVIILIDTQPYDQVDKLNHALLVTGVYRRADGGWEFEYYNPAKNIPKSLLYEKGVFVYGYYPTSVGVFEGDLKKYETQRQMANKVQEINQKTNQKFTLLGSVGDRGKFIGQKSNYALSFQGKDLYPLVSDRYPLKKLAGKNLALEAEFVLSQDDGIEKEWRTPIVKVNKAYEIKQVKRVPTKPAVRERFSVIGRLSDRGKFFGRKGAYEIQDEHHRPVAILTGVDHARALKLLGQDIGVRGRQTDQEGDLPVFTVTEIDDFTEEVYEEIKPEEAP